MRLAVDRQPTMAHSFVPCPGGVLGAAPGEGRTVA
jgi:hypothetical protein